MVVKTIAVVSMCLGMTLGVAACGKKKSNDSPEGLCKQIVAKHKKGIDKMMKEGIAKNEKAFMAVCKTAPVDYLKCDLEHFRSDSCAKMLKTTKWKKKLQHVAITGKTKGD